MTTLRDKPTRTLWAEEDLCKEEEGRDARLLEIINGSIIYSGRGQTYTTKHKPPVETGDMRLVGNVEECEVHDIA